VRTLSQDHGLGPTGAEKLLKYLPDGNVKWTEFEVDTRDALLPLVKVKVMIDGEPAWQVEV
jgi:alkaline phosphatase D